jgi:hypothetical protein
MGMGTRLTSNSTHPGLFGLLAEDEVIFPNDKGRKNAQESVTMDQIYGEGVLGVRAGKDDKQRRGWRLGSYTAEGLVRTRHGHDRDGRQMFWTLTDHLDHTCVMQGRVDCPPST